MKKAWGKFYLIKYFHICSTVMSICQAQTASLTYSSKISCIALILIDWTERKLFNYNSSQFIQRKHLIRLASNALSILSCNSVTWWTCNALNSRCEAVSKFWGRLSFLEGSLPFIHSASVFHLFLTTKYNVDGYFLWTVQREIMASSKSLFQF